jgi:hypothetical protein
MIKKSSITIGILYIIIGLAGFFNNPVIGANGIFLTNTAHNIVHVVFGVLLLYVAIKTKSYILTLKFTGLIYILIAIVGLVATISTGTGFIFNLIAVNSLDNWLHLILGIVIFLLSSSD